MGGLTEEQKLENLKCEWVNICLQVRQGMRKRGIETIPLTRKWDEFEEKKNTAEVGADLTRRYRKGKGQTPLTRRISQKKGICKL